MVSIQRLAVLGATGPLGLQVVHQALAKGYHVTAVVRNPDRMSISNEKLEVVVGDVFSKDSLVPFFQDKDAVFVCLGHHPGWTYRQVTLHRNSIKSIVAAMRECAVKRLVAVTTACTKSKPENPFIVEWLFKPLVMGRICTDMAIMEDYLESDCQDINFTICKPAGLTNDTIKDVLIKAEAGKEYITGTNLSIPRANVAKWMLGCLDTDQFDRKAVAIGINN